MLFDGKSSSEGSRDRHSIQSWGEAGLGADFQPGGSGKDEGHYVQDANRREAEKAIDFKPGLVPRRRSTHRWARERMFFLAFSAFSVKMKAAKAM